MSESAKRDREGRAPWWHGLGHDFRYAVRGLRAKPGFTVAVVLTLALGIGANAAMFSIVDRLLFRPPAFLRDPALTHRIYTATTFRGKEGFNGGVQFARYNDFTRWTTAFARTAEVTTRDLAIGTGDEAREMRAGVVSASFFGFFDAPPVLGRYFTTAEDSTPSGTPVVVLGYGYWRTQFGGRRDAIGSTMHIGPLVYTVIGVAPKGFAGLWPDQPPAVYMPISSYAGTMGFKMKDETWWTTYHWTWAQMIAQRKPGVSVATANADLTSAYLRSYAEQKLTSPGLTPLALARPHAMIASILSERGPNESSLAKVATWVSGVAVIVLLVACANVANLLLARAISRKREIAVRVALGVSRARLLSQLLVESVLLAVLGGVAGMLIAQLGGSVLRATFLPKATAAPVAGDPRTLLFAGAAALAAGLLTGLAPALQATKTDLTTALKAGAREGTYHRSRLRIALLVMQGALSVVLLVGAGLFVKSLGNVKSVRLGYDVTPVLLVNLNMRGVELDSMKKLSLYRDLMDKARALPGVEAVSKQVSVPFWSSWTTNLHVAGIDSVNRLGDFYLNGVSPDYFKALGTRIIRGRGITDEDREGAPGAMVVSEAMAKVLWPGKDPLGQCVRVEADTVPCTYVVGIAESIKNQKLGDDPGLQYYLSAAQQSPIQGGLFIRVHGDAAELGPTVRRGLQPAMPGASYITVTPMSEVLGGQTKSWELGATMFLAFGVLAFVLAAIGLYSVISYDVARRTHELGVRVALGAQVGDLIRLVVSGGLGLAAVGVVIGSVAAFAAGRWVAPLLFNESPRDPVVFALVAGLLMAVAFVASFLPARRAANVDPNRALRSD